MESLGQKTLISLPLVGSKQLSEIIVQFIFLLGTYENPSLPAFSLGPGTEVDYRERGKGMLQEANSTVDLQGSRVFGKSLDNSKKLRPC